MECISLLIAFPLFFASEKIFLRRYRRRNDLTRRGYIEVLEPPHIREIIREKAKKIFKQYL